MIPSFFPLKRNFTAETSVTNDNFVLIVPEHQKVGTKNCFVACFFN